jgi:succinate dehydrogenase / fumarate reductase membrane anchor subunit
MTMRSPLGRVRGLGSAKTGTGHWWSQRLTAIALVPLTLWFVGAVAMRAGADHAEVAAWLSSPWSACLMILLIVATFYHGWLGLQVVIEDYIHDERIKIASLLLVKGASIVLALLALVAVFILISGQ